jgi:hypothetical protein
MLDEDGCIVSLSKLSSSEAAVASTTCWTLVTAIAFLACPLSSQPQVKSVAMWQ